MIHVTQAPPHTPSLLRFVRTAQRRMSENSIGAAAESHARTSDLAPSHRDDSQSPALSGRTQRSRSTPRSDLGGPKWGSACGPILQPGSPTPVVLNEKGRGEQARHDELDALGLHRRSEEHRPTSCVGGNQRVIRNPMACRAASHPQYSRTLSVARSAFSASPSPSLGALRALMARTM